MGRGRQKRKKAKEEERDVMRILIVDDEAMMLEEMQYLVKEVRPEAEISCADSYGKALTFAGQEAFDVAFLDIEMPGMDGLTLARKLKDKCPDMNIIFATAYSKYAVDAFSMYASGYLLKPVKEEQLEEAFAHLRIPIRYEDDKLRVQCFGNFDIFFEGEPVLFNRSLAKELLEYLIDLRGASANTAQLCGILWEDSAKAMENRHYFRNIVAKLKKVLKACRAEKVLICKRNFFAIDVEQVECDYYKFLKGDVAAINSYRGEYMKQYSWAEMTTGALRRQVPEFFSQNDLLFDEKL